MYKKRYQDCRVDKLGDDLLVEILSKLPVKLLLRCRSVSKHWHALTKTANFITRYRQQQRQSDKRHPCMITLNLLQKDGYKAENHKLDDFYSAGNEDQMTSMGFLFVSNEDGLTIMPRRLPMMSYVKNLNEIFLIGSSNGLVYLYMHIDIGCNRDEKVYKYQQVIVIWNPATEEYRILPKPNIINTDIPFSDDEADNIVRVKRGTVEDSLVPVIGLDFVDDEYKMARIFCHAVDSDKRGGRVFRAQVFVPRTNSWRESKCELAFSSRQRWLPRTSITLNGVVYWKVLRGFLVGESRECYVMSFDLRDEVFNVIELPMDLRRNFFSTKLFSWRNSLAAFADNYRMFWVMDCSNKTWAWTPQFTFEDGVFQGASEHLGFWKDDRFIFTRKYLTTPRGTFGPNDLISYHPETQKCEYITMKHRQEVYISHAILNYEETLNSL